MDGSKLDAKADGAAVGKSNATLLPSLNSKKLDRFATLAQEARRTADKVQWRVAWHCVGG